MDEPMLLQLSENFPIEGKIDYLSEFCNFQYFFLLNSLLIYLLESRGETLKSTQKLSKTVVNTVGTSTTLRELTDTK